ncbi:hypothetical protein FA274_13425 [Pseudomonas aeruginosa]|nr:hypothetical protein [Pseudomonas aeruginosa]MDV6630685.1 hypothetical protein [Pseudomonas aeruginosa]
MGVGTLHCVAPSEVSCCWLSPRDCACRAGAFAPCFARSPAQPSSVQVSCLERARLVVATELDGGRAESNTEPPSRRRLERMQQAKAEGKTKGGGTWVPATPVCTWGRSGTARLRRRAVYGAQRAPMLACPRASHARTRPGLPREQS